MQKTNKYFELWIEKASMCLGFERQCLTMIGADNYAIAAQDLKYVFLYFSQNTYSTGKLKLTMQELYNKIIQLELLKGIQLNR